MELQIKTTGVFTKNHLALEDKSLRFITFKQNIFIMSNDDYLLFTKS